MMKSKTNSFYRQLLLLVSFCTLSFTIASAQTVSGVVKDDSGIELPGVNVVIKGTTTGTITDFDGKFSITVNSTSDVLLFSMVGMASSEVVVGDQKNLEVTLSADLVGLDEVIVVGYGTARKKDVTGAVGSVGAASFENQTIRDVDQILQGRTAGVVVTKGSGAPGGTARIRIRGSNSITGNNDPLYVIDGYVGGDFGALNPSDIENIQVLKDASATAIYGSRGANGVVLVTTKKGEKGSAKISFASNFSASQRMKSWDLLSPGDYAELVNENLASTGTALEYTDEEIAYWKANPGAGTDWQDEVFRTAYGQEYQLSISGGGDKNTYFIAGNYVDQQGIIENSDYKRMGIRSNVSSNISDKLKVSVKSAFTRTESNNTGGSTGNRGAIAQMTQWAPTTPARYPDGSINVTDSVGSIWENPLESMANARRVFNNRFNATANLTYTIIPGLNYDLTLGGKLYNRNNKNFTAGLINNSASASQSSTQGLNWQVTNTITYKKIVAGIHKFDVTGVSEQSAGESHYYIANANGLYFPNFEYNNLSSASENTAQASYSGSQLSSFIGRFNYQLMDRYMFTASVRNDGSSKFRGDNKYSTFPSLALGWVISEEAFMPEDLFHNLKLRGSWGKTGSQAIPTYGAITLFDTRIKQSSTSFENGELIPGAVISNPGNPNLKWETTDQINVGLDMSFFDGRLYSNLDFFKKNTHDLLVKVPTAKYQGESDIYSNVGEVLNQGYEIAIGGDIISNEDWNWSSSFNYSYVHNEILSLGDRDEIALGGEGNGDFPTENLLRPGHSLSTFYGLTYLGTWKANEAEEAAVYGQVPGDARYLDRQVEGEEGYGTIDGDDTDIIGEGMPKGTFGWNNTVTYKNFTLNAFFMAMTGFERWNATYGQSLSPTKGAYPTDAALLERWDADLRPNSDIAAFSASSKVYVQSTQFIEKADFMRLKNLSLSYRLDLKEKKSNVVFMISGQNLFTITKYKGLDPEAFGGYLEGVSVDTRGTDMGAYPNARMYSFSMKFNF